MAASTWKSKRQNVTMVAICNMFGLRPREASVLFIANTVMYLVLILPLVLWLMA